MEKPKNVKDTRALSVGTLDVIFIVLLILKSWRNYQENYINKLWEEIIK